MVTRLGTIDLAILLLYGFVLVAMGFYYMRKTRTAEQFMVAGRAIPSWAAGLAIMSAYTSSISYIAVPGMAYTMNWHPFVFALCIPPVALLVCKYVIPYYRKHNIISVYEFLETNLGTWARIYAALCFVVYMIGRAAVIIYLSSLLLSTFIPSWDIRYIILAMGAITILYTLLGGMEAVIWTDVLQSAIMVGGLIFVVVSLSQKMFGDARLVEKAIENGKFSLGSSKLTLTSRTIWVMIIYGVTENLRNLMADQNYVQKYSSVKDLSSARKSVWISMAIYIPLTPVFLFIGTSLYAVYVHGASVLPEGISKGDEVFPYYIATQVPTGLKGLMVAAIMAAAMSTVDSALNCSATVLFLDFYKRFIRPGVTARGSMAFLRSSTMVWGLLGIVFALLMIRAGSALEVWWQISGIFGGGILGLFILSLAGVRLRLWQGLLAVAASVLVISWITFARSLAEGWRWAEADVDPILAGAFGIAVLLLIGFFLSFLNSKATDVH
jgi:SSS family solute:Na+ symporter